MQDPYEILGVSRDAGMDEIKKAYRTLSRRYHPDANINNPNKDKAEEKFKQIQQAYQQILDEKEHGTSYNSSQTAYRQGGYTQNTTGQNEQQYYDPFEELFGYGYRRQQQQQQANDFGGDQRLRSAANYINNGYYNEALNVLENMTENKYSGNWYYLHAIANAGLGNNVTAKEDAQKAVELEPNNMEFRNLLSQLQSGRGWYGQQSGQYGTDCQSQKNSWMMCLPLCCCCGASRLCMPYGFFCC